MSTLVAASPYLFAQAGTFPAPFTFNVPASLEVQPTAATATFDGTAAGAAFLPCLSFYAQSGELLSRVYPQRTVAAGDVAQVSYAPFPGGMTSQGGGGTAALGFQHDGFTVGTEPNANYQDSFPGVVWTLTDDPLGQVVTITGVTWLSVEVNDSAVPTEPTIDFVDTATLTWGFADDPGNSRLQITADVQTPNLQTELLAQTSVSAPGNGAGTLVPWARSSGPALLDLTTPTKPKVIADGVYALTLWIGWDQTHGSPGSTYYWDALLVTDPIGTNAVLATFYSYPHAVIGAGVLNSTVTLSYTGFLAANTVLGVFVQNFSGGALSYGFDWPNGAGTSTVQQLA